MDMLKCIEEAEESAWKYFRQHMEGLARMKESALERQRSSDVMLALHGEAFTKSLPVNGPAFASPAKEESVVMDYQAVPNVSRGNDSMQDDEMVDLPQLKPYKKQKVLRPLSYTVRRVSWGGTQFKYMRAKPTQVLEKYTMEKQPCKNCEGFIRAIGLKQEEINRISKHKPKPVRISPPGEDDLNN